MKDTRKIVWNYVKIILGCAIFGVGFNMFLTPSGLNVGGVSGLSMALVELWGFGSVGLLSIIINIPLFAFGGFKIGKQFKR